MKIGVSLTVALILLQCLRFGFAAPGGDKHDQLINRTLTRLSTLKGGQPTECGTTFVYKPEANVTDCVESAFAVRKPFWALYTNEAGLFKSDYGLAGDSAGDVYEVQFDSRELLNLGMRRNSQVLNGNRIRVTTCLEPIHLATTEAGLPVCITPVNEKESQIAAQQDLIETTVCRILEHPSAFNNRMVRVSGHASASFEYSGLTGDGCFGAIWLEYPNDELPPAVAATVPGGASSGSEDAEGRLILPVPVTLIKDRDFQQFQLLAGGGENTDRQGQWPIRAPGTLHRIQETLVGRIDAVSDDVHEFHLRRNKLDRPDYLGFGQMGLFDAQLVLQSVKLEEIRGASDQRNWPPRE